MISRHRLIFFAWVAFFITTTAYWIFKNNFPPGWDEAHYLMGSEVLRQALTEHGFLAFLVGTTTVLGTKAPLITILPLPFYLFFGSSPHSAMLVNIIFALVFFLFFYKLVSQIFDEKIALASSAIISTMPLFYGLLRYFLVEFGLTALVVIWIYLALKTEDLVNKRYLFLLGLLSGLGVMMKFHFFLFVAGPALVILTEAWKKSRKAIFDLRNILIFSIPAILVALPWYSRNILTVLWKAKRSTNPVILGDLYYGPPLSIANLYRSGLDFINYVMSTYWFIVLFALLAIFFYQRKILKINNLLLGWFLIPFIAFYLGPNKDFRLMLPLLPPVAIFISVLMAHLFTKRLLPALAILMIFPTIIYLNTSVLVAKLIQRRISFGPLVLADKQIGGYVQIPRVDKWPVEESLRYIESFNTGGTSKTVILASENEAFNINSLQYYSLLYHLPLKIQTVSYFPPGTNYMTIKAIIDGGNYILTKVGGDGGPSNLNRFNDLILSKLDTQIWKEIPNEIALPDGGKLKIWQRIL